MFRSYLEKRRIKKLKEKLNVCGAKVYIGENVELVYPERISIDSNVHIQQGCKFFGGGGISIGQGTILAHDIQIFSQNHYYDGEDLKYLPYDEKFINKKVVIGKYVWVGARASILPGVRIGDGAVIGAGAVVSRDIPECAVVGGNPASIIKYRNIEVYRKLSQEAKGYIAQKRY